MTTNSVNFLSNQMHIDSDAINSENASTHQQKKYFPNSTTKNSYQVGFSAPACLTGLVILNQKFTQDLSFGLKSVTNWTDQAIIEPINKFFISARPLNTEILNPKDDEHYLYVSSLPKTCAYLPSPFMQHVNSAWTSATKYLSQETGKEIFNHKISYGEAAAALASVIAVGLAIKHCLSKSKAANSNS